MEILKISAVALSAVILIVIVKNYKPEYGILTTLGCSILLLYLLTDSLKYGFAYISKLYNDLENGKTYFPILIKVMIIAYITEFTSQLCKDTGETSIASKIELGGKILIFCVAIPIFSSILQLVDNLL